MCYNVARNTTRNDPTAQISISVSPIEVMNKKKVSYDKHIFLVLQNYDVNNLEKVISTFLLYIFSCSGWIGIDCSNRNEVIEILLNY